MPLKAETFLKVLTVYNSAVIPITFYETLLPNSTSSDPSSWGAYSIGGPFNTSSSYLKTTYYRRNPGPDSSMPTYNTTYAPFSSNTTSTSAPNGIGQAPIPQPPLIQVSSLPATRAASCISYIGFVGAMGEQAAWLGDMGRACNQDWYYSSDVVGVYSTTSSSGQKVQQPYQPFCTWLDGSHGNNARNTGVQINLAEFLYNTPTIWKTVEYLCKFPQMVFQQYNLASGGFWNASTPGISGAGIGGRRRKREAEEARIKRRQEIQKTMDGRLVVTNNPAHAVMQLCASETSLGPNLVNTHEGLFCLMRGKAVWEVCSANGTKVECFDVGQSILRQAGAETVLRFDSTEYWNV